MDSQVSTDRDLQLKFDGGPVRPQDLKIGQLHEVLVHFEAALSAIAYGDAAQPDGAGLGIGVAAIQEGSVDLRIRARAASLAMSALLTLGAAIKVNNFTELHPAARTAIGWIVDFAKARQLTAQVAFVDRRDGGESIEVLARTTSETVVPKPSHTKGDTRLYGRVLRVGGEEPAVQLRTARGKMTVQVSAGMAQEAAKRLYKNVMMVGTATWDNDTLQMTKFEAREMLDFDPLPLDELVNQARLTFGGLFDEVDLGQFVRERGDE